MSDEQPEAESPPWQHFLWAAVIVIGIGGFLLLKNMEETGGTGRIKETG